MAGHAVTATVHGTGCVALLHCCAEHSTHTPAPFVAQVGNATIRFVASTGAGDTAASDALEVVVPVLGRQGSVYVATSFAIRPNASR